MNNAQKNARIAALEELRRMDFPERYNATFVQSASIHSATIENH